MTTIEAVKALRRAAKAIELMARDRPNRSAADVCRLVGEAMRTIEDAKMVLRNDECWRQRGEADVAAMVRR